MKQTAVEFLQMMQIKNNNLSKTDFKIAKGIENSQIGEAYEDGYSDSDNNFEFNKEYYNEKFKNK
jgi:hypothetical protein